MKIKEIEYGETKSVNFNNYRLIVRIEVTGDENLSSEVDKLKVAIRKKLSEIIEENSWEVKDLTETKNNIKKEVCELGKQRKELMEFIEKAKGFAEFMKEMGKK
jgi:DNA repair exonuclease SbcCD nuclease subunit